MPVQSRYNANLELGTPVLKGFWTNFLNTRAEINARIMGDAASTPGERDRAIRALYDRMADLVAEEQKLSTGISSSESRAAKMDNDLLLQVIKSAGSVESAGISARARVDAAKLDSITGIETLLVESAAEKNKSYLDGYSVGGAISGYARDSGELARQLNQKAGGDKIKQLGILDRIEKAGPLSDDVRKYIAQQTPGREPGEDMRAYAARTMGLHTPEEAQEFADEMVADYQGGGDPVRFISRTLGALGMTPAQVQDHLSRFDISTGKSESARGSGAAPSTARGKKDLEDTLANNRAMQKQILDRIKKLEAEQDRPAGRFSGFYKNAVTETLLRTPSEDDRKKLDIFGDLTPDEVKTLASAMKETGGDVDAALDLIASRKKKPAGNDKLRADGTTKGEGWLGSMDRPDGSTSSELSIGVEFDGREVQIPTMVPTLSESEVDYLLATPPGEIFTRDPAVGASIKAKAIKHAKDRMSQGKSPFVEPSDQEPSATKPAPDSAPPPKTKTGKEKAAETVSLPALPASAGTGPVTTDDLFAMRTRASAAGLDNLEFDIQGGKTNKGSSPTGWSGENPPPVSPNFVEDPEEAFLMGNASPNVPGVISPEYRQKQERVDSYRMRQNAIESLTRALNEVPPEAKPVIMQKIKQMADLTAAQWPQIEQDLRDLEASP